MSGLPLKLSVKMQINLAMHDVSNMANVELFSHLVLPMLWFEIVSDCDRNIMKVPGCRCVCAFDTQIVPHMCR